MSVSVYVSIGSNIEPARHVKQALVDLTAAFGVLQISPIYETEAVGFDGDNFYNLVVGFETDLSVVDLDEQLSQIELDNGRTRDSQRFNARTLDLDLLLYGDAILTEQGWNIPRDEIDKYAFVLKPLLDLYPQGKHPQTNRSYAELWVSMQAQQAVEMLEVRLDL